MKNFNRFGRYTVPAASFLLLAALTATLLQSCDNFDRSGDCVSEPHPATVEPAAALDVSPEGIARMLSSLPLTIDQLREVHSAVSASSANGYDEEYTFSSIFSTPGLGVGDELLQTRSAVTGDASTTLAGLISSSSDISTRSAGIEEALSGSGLQIYWPYSEDWDGRTFPVITFNPEACQDGGGTGTGYSSAGICRDLPEDSSIGFQRELLPDGSVIINEIIVDEDYARQHPVWVVNRNEDAGRMTPQMLEALYPERSASTRANGDFKTLVVKEFKAHRNYDSWLAGASEFFIKCGSIEGFNAQTEEEIKLFYPSVTDLMINVKRKQVGKYLRFNTVVVSEWTPQLEECVFLMIEDDGGKQTTWKATGVVKIKSKSYGFEVEFPLNRNDDLVWRGKLSSSYFEKYNGSPNRFGDVSVTFNFI